jgi:hypothetical protein
MYANIMTFQFMCWMLSQLSALWQNRRILAVETPAGETEGGGNSESAVAWRPWEHIQPHPKGTPAPQFNPSGKYCVRLYWMVSSRLLCSIDLCYCITTVQFSVSISQQWSIGNYFK